VFTFIQLFTS